jgi:hypothetical protein
MRILRIGLVVAIVVGVLGIDVGESVRAGAIVDGSAHAAKHRSHKRKHARKRHHKRKHRRRHHAPPPATEM